MKKTSISKFLGVSLLVILILVGTFGYINGYIKWTGGVLNRFSSQTSSGAYLSSSLANLQLTQTETFAPSPSRTGTLIPTIRSINSPSPTVRPTDTSLPIFMLTSTSLPSLTPVPQGKNPLATSTVLPTSPPNPPKTPAPTDEITVEPPATSPPETPLPPTIEPTVAP